MMIATFTDAIIIFTSMIVTMITSMGATIGKVIAQAVMATRCPEARSRALGGDGDVAAGEDEAIM